MHQTVLAFTFVVLTGLGPLNASSQVASLAGGTARSGSSKHDGTRQGRLMGARLTLPLTRQFEVRVGPDYVERNLSELPIGSPVAGVVQVLAYENSYLEVPVLLKASPFAGARVSPHILTGLAVGFNLRCRAVTTSFSFDAFGQTRLIGESATSCEDDLIGNSVHRLQLDARVGLGVDVRLPRRLLGTLEITYGAGVVKIFELFAAKSRATLIRVGVGVPLT